jgi:8-oxo-dGTP diphosphatase
MSEDNEKKDHPWIGADSIIINDKGQILLGKRSSHMRAHPDKWGLIGGYVEWGETVKEALIREAKEEIGVDIEVVRFLGRYYDSPDRHPKKTVFCLPHISKILSGEPTTSNEVSEVRWFEPSEIKDLELAYDHKQMLIDEGLI